MAYSEDEKNEILKSICDKIEEGKALRNILKEKDMPDSKTFYKWIDEDEEKIQQYTRACEARADLIFEDILHIADDTSKDTQTVDIGGVEIEQINHDAINRSRLRVDTRKWMLGKMNPKKYGDKLSVDTSGTPIIQVVDMGQKQE